MPSGCFRYLLALTLLLPGLAGAVDRLNDWQWRNTILQGNDLRDLTFGGGLHVAVGAYGTVVVSTNGVDWQFRSLEVAKDLVAVTYGNGRFVAVGRNAADHPQCVIMMSSNGVDWVDVSPGEAGVLTGVAYGDGKFVAVGNRYNIGGTILLISNDGNSWISETDPEIGLEKLAWGGGRFVSVAGDTVSSSTNGSAWELTPTVVPDFDEANVRYVSTGFMVAGAVDDYLDSEEDIAAFMFSADGQEWTVGTVVPAVTYERVEVYDVGLLNGVYVASGSINDKPAAWMSTNGSGWFEAASATFERIPFAISGQGGVFVAVGGGGWIATSDTGTNWTQRAGVITNRSAAVVYGNGLYVAVGADGIVQSSPDAIVWTGRQVVPSQYWWDVAFGNDRFVAVSLGGRIMSSPDAITWASQVPVNFNYFGVAYGQGKFVAVGDGRLVPAFAGSYGIISSPDGLVWTGAVTGTGFGLFGVTYGDGIFMAVGNGGSILRSTNALQWTGCILHADAGISTPFFRGVAYGHGKFVAVGTESSPLARPVVAYTTNGLDWYATLAPPSNTSYSLDTVAFGHGVFLAASAPGQLTAGTGGGGKILTSFDGMSWQERHSPTSQPLSDITADETSFLLVSPAGPMLQSGDLRPRLRLAPCCFPLADRQRLWLQGLSNGNYQTEFSTNLIHWMPGWTNRAQGAEVQVLETGLQSPQGYYRARPTRP